MRSVGRRKTVRVSGGSNYRGRLNIQFARLIIDRLVIFQHFSIQYTKYSANLPSETITRLCILMIIQYYECNSSYTQDHYDREMTDKYVICSLH